jgi:hypothetical protein
LEGGVERVESSKLKVEGEEKSFTTEVTEEEHRGHREERRRVTQDPGTHSVPGAPSVLVEVSGSF